MIRLVREIQPDVIITNRPNDYHPDHRYTSLLIQDSAYMFMVPHVAPDAPPLHYNPVIFYWADSFTYPRQFEPTVAVSVDEAFDLKLSMLNEHESQLFEWLPWVERYPDPVPSAEPARREWLERYYKHRFVPTIADRYRDLLTERYGAERGGAVVEAEAFELCEYGTRADAEMLAELFQEL
jgi:LmbE family N-acetylglucosaminyl deacetylase